MLFSDSIGLFLHWKRPGPVFPERNGDMEKSFLDCRALKYQELL